MLQYPRIGASGPLSSSLWMGIVGMELVPSDGDFDLGRLEAMGSWIVRMENKVNGHERHVVHRLLVEQVAAVLIVAVLQAVYVGRYKSSPGHHAFVNAFLMQLQPLLGPVGIFVLFWLCLFGESSWGWGWGRWWYVE